MMSLAGLWTTMQGLPFPVVVGAGVMLAIASNRTLHIRRAIRAPSGQGTRSGQGDRPQPLSSPEATPKSAHLSADPQLPPFSSSSSHQSARSISFKIDSTKDSHHG